MPDNLTEIWYTNGSGKQCRLADVQGDIVAVYNESGTKVCSYFYDAWGNTMPMWHDGTGTNIYAELNPFTYRGYYYDADLGLYVLQTRCYDPATGRFINADG